MKPSVEVVEPKLFAGIVADELIASISDRVADSGSCSVALSGGSTPSAIYRMLTVPPRVDEVDWPKVRIFWGDERWVDHSDNQSNFKMAQETLLSQISSRQPQVFPVDTTLSTPEKGAEAYETTIRKALNVPETDVPIFDIILLGLGEDGHTASLFPGSPLLTVPASSSRICGTAVHPADGTSRITLLPNVILRARQVYVIVKGASKAPIVKRVLEGRGEETALPAKILERAEGRVTWFLDSAAGANVSHS